MDARFEKAEAAEQKNQKTQEQIKDIKSHAFGNQLLSSVAFAADAYVNIVISRMVRDYRTKVENPSNPGESDTVDNGKPWAEINYSLMRKARWLSEKSFEPSRLVTAWYRRKCGIKN